MARRSLGSAGPFHFLQRQRQLGPACLPVVPRPCSIVQMLQGMQAKVLIQKSRGKEPASIAFKTVGRLVSMLMSWNASRHAATRHLITVRCHGRGGMDVREATTPPCRCILCSPRPNEDPGFMGSSSHHRVVKRVVLLEALYGFFDLLARLGRVSLEPGRRRGRSGDLPWDPG